jgi:putative FmdB family regulatory protein
VPTYSYACKKCEHAFDIQQALSEPSLSVCPKCQGELRKVFGQVGVTFKGSGFYRNDSGAGSKNSD